MVACHTIRTCVARPVFLKQDSANRLYQGFRETKICSSNNNNIYLLQLGRYPVVVVILHINKTGNWLLINLSREGYMRSM